MNETNVISTETPLSGESIVSVEADEEILREIGYGILGRGMDIHDNPDDDHEDVAEALKDIGQEIVSVYSEVESFD